MAHDRPYPYPLTARLSIIAPGTPLLTSLFMQLSSMIMDEVMLPVPELQPAMPYYDVLWNHEDKDGNVAHIAEHGLTPEDVNAVLMAPDETGVSRSSGRPIAFGYTPDGRYICVVYEEVVPYTDNDFAALFPTWGYPGLPPWRLALVTVMQFRENLADRQAAEAVRARIDWKYLLGLELTDPGFDFSVLSAFRDRLPTGSAAELLLDKRLGRCRMMGLLKARGQQRTDSTHVLAAIRVLNHLELVAETLRAALNELATVAPAWLQGLAPLA